MRLTDIKNQNKDDMQVVLSQLDIEIPELIPANLRARVEAAKNATYHKEDKAPTMRNQVLRWYNANPAVFAVTVKTLLDKLSAFNDIQELRKFAESIHINNASLSMRPENFEVDDITLLEDYLLITYPVANQVIAATGLDKVGLPTEKLVKLDDMSMLDVFKLCRAVVKYTQKNKDKLGYEFTHLDLSDMQTL